MIQYKSVISGPDSQFPVVFPSCPSSSLWKSLSMSFQENRASGGHCQCQGLSLVFMLNLQDFYWNHTPCLYEDAQTTRARNVKRYIKTHRRWGRICWMHGCDLRTPHPCCMRLDVIKPRLLSSLWVLNMPVLGFYLSTHGVCVCGIVGGDAQWTLVDSDRCILLNGYFRASRCRSHRSI